MCATAALAAIVVGAGCGGGGEDSTTASRQAEISQAQAEANAKLRASNAKVEREYQRRRRAEAPTSDEREAAQAATRFYAILGTDKAAKSKSKTVIDSTAFCELMSEQAVAETVRYAEVASGIRQRWDCESAVELLALRSKRNGGYQSLRAAEVIGLNAQGDRATATVRFGDGPVTAIPLVKEGGEWKLAASSIGGQR